MVRDFWMLVKRVNVNVMIYTLLGHLFEFNGNSLVIGACFNFTSSKQKVNMVRSLWLGWQNASCCHYCVNNRSESVPPSVRTMAASLVISISGTDAGAVAIGTASPAITYWHVYCSRLWLVACQDTQPIPTELRGEIPPIGVNVAV